MFVVELLNNEETKEELPELLVMLLELLVESNSGAGAGPFEYHSPRKGCRSIIVPAPRGRVQRCSLYCVLTILELRMVVQWSNHMLFDMVRSTSHCYFDVT